MADSTHEKELMAALSLTGNSLHKGEMEYHENFGHAIGRIQHIYLMSRINISYTNVCLATETVASTIPGFQDITNCVQYMASQPHTPIFHPYNYYYGSNFIRITWVGNKVEDYTTHNCL